MIADFAYHNESTRRLELEFMDLVDTSVPFFALSDSLIALMEKRNYNYFDIPPQKTFSNKWLRFHFTTKNEKTYKIYFYDRLETFDEKPSGHKE